MEVNGIIDCQLRNLREVVNDNSSCASGLLPTLNAAIAKFDACDYNDSYSAKSKLTSFKAAIGGTSCSPTLKADMEARVKAAIFGLDGPPTGGGPPTCPSYPTTCGP
jgi:hypothetical protein